MTIAETFHEAHALADMTMKEFAGELSAIQLTDSEAAGDDQEEAWAFRMDRRERGGESWEVGANRGHPMTTCQLSFDRSGPLFQPIGRLHWEPQKWCSFSPKWSMNSFRTCTSPSDKSSALCDGPEKLRISRCCSEHLPELRRSTSLP